MFRAGTSLLARTLGRVEPNASTQSLDSLAELQSLESAMRAAAQIMNDDVDAAEEGLSHGNSSFHKLGKGLVAFIRATLGFEQEIMREASERLADAEAAASHDHRRIQRDANAFRSSIYPPGAELALCHAMSQLMSAVVGVLNESLTESIKGFYKLRKAYMTLESILDAESTFMKSQSEPRLAKERTSMESFTSSHSSPSLRVPGAFDEIESENPSGKASPKSINGEGNGKSGASAPGEDEFFDASEAKQGEITPETYEGNIDIKNIEEKTAALSIEPQPLVSSTFSKPPTIPKKNALLIDYNPDSEIFANPIDVFIHSGANLCFGILLIMISMIPPAFGKLLFIIGFKGDRERGLRMLWQSSKFHNISGAMAGLVLLAYYNGLSSFCDILPDPPADDEDNPEGYPKERCHALLADLRERFPRSKLWLLEEARMKAANKSLDTALTLLRGDLKSPLKQVEALGVFEKSLDSMYAHRYQESADSFLECMKINTWSHALYYYIAGINHLALYRQYSARSSTPNPKLASNHAKLATKFLQTAPTHAGKKRFMARQLPFDVFVARKVEKWSTRAKDRGIDFIDAAGVSPVIEMIFLWNGLKRMTPELLQKCLDALFYDTHSPTWDQEDKDEKALEALIRASVTRHLGHPADARAILTAEVMDIDRKEFKGPGKDDWVQPSACFEIAATHWEEKDLSPPNSSSTLFHHQRDMVAKTKEWTDKASNWESFELEARLGMKFRVALQTVQWWEERNVNVISHAHTTAF
ncbi:MAG: Tetratricopeptide repeat protein 39C [Cirrosporium novae-zelandiae]|nr:MAG: Tetratricopeptide repeat protein 39C [Cirrosporium novae-zelandiae]